MPSSPIPQEVNLSILEWLGLSLAWSDLSTAYACNKYLL